MINFPFLKTRQIKILIILNLLRSQEIVNFFLPDNSDNLSNKDIENKNDVFKNAVYLRKRVNIYQNGENW